MIKNYYICFLFLILLFNKAISQTTSLTTTNSITTPNVETTTFLSTETEQVSSSASTETSTPTTTPVPTTPPQISTKSFTWSSSALDDYTSFVFSVEEGYFISVNVSNVNMSDNFYISIQGGSSKQEGATDGRIFANTVKGPLAYLFKTSSVYASCESLSGEKCTQDSVSFSVEFKQTGEPATTVSTTTVTTLSVPSTQQDDSVYLTVNVSGRYLRDYDNEDTRNAFQSCVVIMAENYCKRQNIPLTQNITNAYVRISDISSCPYNWPDSVKCVRITFQLPIFYNESEKWTGYQLNTENLKIMWLRWSELDNQCFSENSFEIYTVPDIEHSIMWWAIGISLVLIAFIVLLVFLRGCGAKVRTALRTRKRGDDSDTESIISKERSSISSLTPHYLSDHLQLDTPKFFEP